MRILSLFTTLSLLLGVAANAEAAKKKVKPITGVITMVKQDDGDKESGTFTMKVAPAKNADPAAPIEEKTFKVSTSTKIEMVTGKKPDLTTSAAKFSDLAEGKTVTVVVNAAGDTADSVKIMPSKKKKKNT